MGKTIVTSALPYVNGVKHLGNMVGSLLPADVCARFLRMKGEDVIYICGTDEHGTPAELGALEEKLPIEEYCLRYYERQKGIYLQFGLKFDYFGRTSSTSNREITQRLFLRLYENGFIEEKVIRQMFCVDDNRFLPDRYIKGTCPKCKNPNARGDQCELCQTLLDPEELIDPQSTVSGSRNLEIRETKHLFLKLADLQPRIESWIESKTHWPNTVLGIARKWLKEGLQPRCITRDLKWGVPVPLEGWKDKVFYVWFDAPIGYISITKDWAESIGKPDLWKDYWKDEGTKLIQFLGKDNVPFHAVTWPSSMMGADDGFVLAHTIKGFEWLQYEGGKFSTSGNRGVFTDQALDICPADYWRFYLMYNAPERSDSNFSWDDFGALINSALADSLGNFAQRTISLLQRRMGGKIPSQWSPRPEDEGILKELNSAVEEWKENMTDLRFTAATRRLHNFWIACNQYITANEPWSKFKTDFNHATNTITLCLHLLRSSAILASPLIPFGAQKIFDALCVNETVENLSVDDAKDFQKLLGHEIPAPPTPLFQKIEAEQIAEWKLKYGGGR